MDITTWVDKLAFERGANGLIGAPPVRVQKRFVPGLPGAVYQQKIHDVKPVALPLVGESAGYEDMINLVRRMALMMDPILNEGILRYTRDDGTYADLNATVIEGLETEGLGDLGPNGQRFAIRLECVDPYWYEEEQSRLFQQADPVPWFGPGLFPPLTLGPSSVIGDVDLNVETDVPTYPVWTIGNAMESISLVNNASNLSFTTDSTAVMVSGERLTIDTRRRGATAVTVIGPGATDDDKNWFKKSITGERSLWPLLPGNNPIEINMTGVDEDSFVLLKWRNARLTP